MRSLRDKLADLPSSQRRDPVRQSALEPREGGVAAGNDERGRPGESKQGLSGFPRDPRQPLPRAGVTAGATVAPKPSLDELRARIAALVGYKEPPPPRPDPSAGELPFFVEHTPAGPRYVRRVRAAPAARVGRAPLVAARDADPVTLGLLALDPALSGCDPRKALYLDTETTGLAGGTGTVAFLLGLAFFDEAQGSWIVEQMLLRRLGEEAPILDLLSRRLAEASMIVTYNGKAFDMPLLRTRFVMNRLPRPHEPPHLDLLHVARRVHKHRLATCSLASIENEVLGLERVGDISGMDIVEAYAHFLRTRDESALHGVVTHNEQDVLSMVALLGLYGEPFGQIDGVELATLEVDGAAACAGVGAGLGASDLASVARTLHRAGASDRALALAGEAVRAGGGVHARRVSADISRARGDTTAALREYEAILIEVDDPDVRLVLVKLYEHRERAFERALALLAGGTGESEEASGVRRARLERKLLVRERAPQRKRRTASATAASASEGDAASAASPPDPPRSPASPPAPRKS